MKINRDQLTACFEKAKNGDNEAWSNIYEIIYRDIHYICMEYLKNEDDTQDAEQETFIKIYQKADQLENNESFLPWAKKIAVNTCQNMLKKHKEATFSEIEEEMSTAEQDAEFDPEDANITFRPEEQADIKETARLIHDMMAELPDEQRISLELLYGSELSVKEIAEAMECSENTVKSRLHYGRKAMEEKVEALRRQGIKLYALPAIVLIRAVCRNQIESYAAEASGEALSSLLHWAASPKTVTDYEAQELIHQFSHMESMDSFEEIHETALEKKKEADKAKKEAKREAKDAEKERKQQLKEEEKAQKEEEREQKKADKAAEKDAKEAEKARKQEIRQEEKAAKSAERKAELSEKKENISQAVTKAKTGLSAAGKAVIGVVAAAAVTVCGFFTLNNNQKTNTIVVPETTITVPVETQSKSTIEETKSAPAVTKTQPSEKVGEIEVHEIKKKVAVNPPMKGECIVVKTMVTSGRKSEEQSNSPQSEQVTNIQDYNERAESNHTTEQQTNPYTEQSTEPETQEQNQAVEESGGNLENDSYLFGDPEKGYRWYIGKLTDSEIAAYEAEYGPLVSVYAGEVKTK